MSRYIDADALKHCIEIEVGLNPMQDGFLYDDVVKEIIDAQPTADVEPVEWIPVTERLPEPLESVLVTSDMGSVYISYIVHGEFEYGGNVIAWMPLPEPYERKKGREE